MAKGNTSGSNSGNRNHNTFSDLSHNSSSGNRSFPMDEFNPQNQSGTYYVHPNENPNSSLVAAPLNGRSYHNWAKWMKRSLISKNKFEFIDGSILKPEEFDPLFKAWTRCNNIVHSCILSSISPAITDSISCLDTTYATWIDLRERFAQADLVRIAELQ
jgi:hypothetical protein